jgi:type IV secretory pathway TraG/TraD family ATPase VirD4
VQGKKPLQFIFGIFLFSLIASLAATPTIAEPQQGAGISVSNGSKKAAKSPIGNNKNQVPKKDDKDPLSSIKQQIPAPLKDPANLLILVGGFLAWFFLFRDSGKPKNKKMASAQWAGPIETKNAVKRAKQQVLEQKHDGLSLWINPAHKPGAFLNNKKRHFQPGAGTIAVPDNQRGTAVIGSPGVGKTFGWIDPLARSSVEQGVPIILYDFKFRSSGSQAEMLSGWAKKHGYKVIIFAPGFAGSMVCNLLDFLKSPDDSDSAGQIAATLTRNFSASGGKGGEDPFFQKSGDQLVKAVLQLAKATSEPDVLTCQKILAMSPKELAEKIGAASKVSPWVKISWDQFISMHESEKTVASVIATAALMFTSFVTPDVLPSVVGKSNLPLDVDGKTLVIFGMDQNRRDIIGPILATVMHMLITRNLAKKRKDPLYVVADEFPTIILPAFLKWLMESRGAGFCGLIGFQNLGQLEQAYGKEVARAIMSGCNTKVIFNPGEYESAKLFSDYLGSEHVDYKQRSKSSSKGGASTSHSEQERMKLLMAPDEYLRLGTGQCIFINPSYKNSDHSFIPVRLTIKLNKQELRNTAIAKQASISLLEELEAKFPKKDLDITDLSAKQAAIDFLLAPDDDTNANKKGNLASSFVNALEHSVSASDSPTQVPGASPVLFTDAVDAMIEQEMQDFFANNAIDLIDAYDRQKTCLEQLDDLPSDDEWSIPAYVDESSPSDETVVSDSSESDSITGKFVAF